MSPHCFADEEDEKRIRQAENRALRSIKDRKVRTQPYPQIPVRTPVAPAVQTAPNPAYTQAPAELSAIRINSLRSLNLVIKSIAT
jgi:hypothetical protein